MFIRLLVLGGFYGGVNRGDTPLFFTWLRNTFYMAYKKVLRSLPARNA